MNWKNEKYIDENKYDIPGNWLHIQYFEALNILFRIENSLRVFVFIILKNEYKEKWCNLSITSDDEESSTINAIAKKRLTQDKNYAYLGFVLNSQLLHLTSGELIRIITSDSYWKLFKDYFLGNKTIIQNKLDEIGNVRNSLAHFRPIKNGDVELIKQNSIHTLTEIEKTIKDFISCPDNVPTNTEDNWYKELSNLSSTNCQLSFQQSKQEEWIKIIFKFNCPILRNEKLYVSYDLRSLNIKANNILNIYSSLKNQVICVTERVSQISFQNPENIKIDKEVRFTFSKKNLVENYKIILDEFRNLINQIESEIELIENDNLARGKIVEVVNFSLYRRGESKYYSADNKYLITEIDENSPVEFWGTLNYSSSNFVSDSEFYPWMPVSISDDKDLPF